MLSEWNAFIFRELTVSHLTQNCRVGFILSTLYMYIHIYIHIRKQMLRS